MITKNVLVTGSQGFIGRNLKAALLRRSDVALDTFDSDSPADALPGKLAKANLVYHLAGVNRPTDTADFDRSNRDLTQQIVDCLLAQQSTALVVFSSSTQAELDNHYGRSKQAAEQALLDARPQGLNACIYRLPGVFGKWSRPHYNTVVATFCHNIARGKEITISDPNHPLTLVYIDDVVQRLLSHLDQDPSQAEPHGAVQPTYGVTLGRLAEMIRGFHEIRSSKRVPDLSDNLTRRLYSTYLSFLKQDDFAYPAAMHTDPRGWLFELLKSDAFGQIFVSATKPGVTRGNHYHDSKVEKFCVVRGSGLIRLRHLESEQVIEYPIDDRQIKLVDIPPGYTHSIENTGDREMVTLFWANEAFDPDRPDTYWEEVLK